MVGPDKTQKTLGSSRDDVTFAAEWCTTNEVVILRCVSVFFVVVVNEWQYKGILDYILGRQCLRIGTPACRSGAPAPLFESFDSLAPLGPSLTATLSRSENSDTPVPTNQGNSVSSPLKKENF